MGSFWKIGLQQTLYLPGAWLQQGKNKIIILDVDQPTSTKATGLVNTICEDKTCSFTQIIIDLGQVESIKGLRYLHRFDNKPEGYDKGL